jgi:glycosyltransferase involved in cell wall biosynthesis
MLVHSQFQENILRLDTRRPAPSAVVPHGIPEVDRNGSEAVRAGKLIVSYGGVEIAPKRLDLVLRGFAELTRALPDTRLALVGGGPPGEIVAVQALAGELGIADRIELPGRVDDTAYWEMLAGASLAVQLRGGSNAGEASGAVCDCIAARVPTVVSDAGWFAELPERVVLPIGEESSPERLAERMRSAIEDDGLRDEIAEAQDRYASETSFERVAERYVDVLDL